MRQWHDPAGLARARQRAVSQRSGVKRMYRVKTMGTIRLPSQSPTGLSYGQQSAGLLEFPQNRKKCQCPAIRDLIP